MNKLVTPIDSMLSITSCRGRGAKAYNSRDPSRGGHGMELNMNRTTFNFIDISKKV